MFAGLHSRRKKKAGVLFFLIQGVSLQVYLGWFLFFMKGDYDWRLGFQKDEELCIYEGGGFCKGGIFQVLSRGRRN
jgi:hypothetical protein